MNKNACCRVDPGDGALLFRDAAKDLKNERNHERAAEAHAQAGYLFIEDKSDVSAAVEFHEAVKQLVIYKQALQRDGKEWN